MAAQQGPPLALPLPRQGAARRSARRQRIAARLLLLTPAVFVVLATTTYPLLSAFLSSLRDWQLTLAPNPGAWVGLQNYIQAFGDAGFINAIVVTLEFTVLSVTLSIILAMAIALVLYKPGRINLIARTLLIFPFAVSPALKGYSWKFMLDPGYGVYEKIIGFFVPAAQGYIWLTHQGWALFWLAMSEVWGWAPLIALMFIGALSAISPEIFEAARVDGASRLVLFRRIMLPLLRPVLLTAVLLKTIFSLKLFDQVVTMTGGGPGDATQTLNYYVYQAAFRDFNMGYASALAIILVLALSIFAFIYVKVMLGKAA